MFWFLFKWKSGRFKFLTGLPLLLETLPQNLARNQDNRFRKFCSLLDIFDRTFMWPTIKKRTKKVWRDYASTNICLTRRHDWSSTPPSSLFFDFLVERFLNFNLSPLLTNNKGVNRLLLGNPIFDFSQNKQCCKSQIKGIKPLRGQSFLRILGADAGHWPPLIVELITLIILYDSLRIFSKVA